MTVFDYRPTGDFFESQPVYRLLLPARTIAALPGYRLYGYTRVVDRNAWARALRDNVELPPEFDASDIVFLYHRISTGMVEFVLLSDSAPRKGWVSPPIEDVVPVSTLNNTYCTVSNEAYLLTDGCYYLVVS